MGSTHRWTPYLQRQRNKEEAEAVRSAERSEERSDTEMEDSPRDDVIRNSEDPISDFHQLRSVPPMSPSATPRRPLKETRCLNTMVDRKGNKFVNQYIIIKVLGTGSHGKVKLCLNTQDSTLYAIKIIDKRLLSKRRFGSRKSPIEEVMREIAIMKKLQNPNVVTLYEVIDDPNGSKLFMVLEYVACGPVMTRENSKPMPENLAHHFFRDICKGLDYLHYHKIVHRDLKPENLLKAADGTVKISDFGVSDVFDKSDALNKSAGTPAFVAPETLIPGKSFHGRSADVWSLGVCLYNFVAGHPPFDGDNVFEIFHKIQYDHVQVPEHLSPELKDLLVRTLQKDPSRRLTLPAIMSHPWVTINGALPLASITKMEQLSVSEHEVLNAVQMDRSGLLALFESVFTERIYEDGEFIIMQGDEGNDMFFINCGECDVLFNTKLGKGKEAGFNPADPGRLVAVREAGQFVGEMALFGSPDDAGNRRSASVRARGEVKVLVVTKDEVMHIIQNNAFAEEQIRSTMAQRQHETMQKLRSFSV
eukprot:jgi/Mesvir1/949/Mv17503-RA.1